MAFHFITLILCNRKCKETWNMKGSLSWSEVLNSILFKKWQEKIRQRTLPFPSSNYWPLFLVFIFVYLCKKRKRKEEFTLHTNSDTIAAKTKKKKRSWPFPLQKLEMVIQEIWWLAYHKISLAWGIFSSLKKLIIDY